MKSSLSLLLFTLSFILFAGCQNPPEESAELILPESGIAIEDAWARPGRANGVTAVYMHVLNGSAETDTLVAISSPVAGLVELHETFDRGDGMMGMRESEEPFFPGESVVSMRPGGLHIMLMQLREALQEGDEVEVTLEFSIAGEMTLSVPVQSPDSRTTGVHSH
ncbi:MAG: copper chaperone PCu(A)C [Balneolaceae bacterium]|nr:MAG: copper chaperone PCu(A)C [Balneolaceae bacterium]